MQAEIVAAGSELLTPYRQDTDSLYLTGGLNDLGVTVAFKTIAGDSLRNLTDAARIALARADIVIFTGGLGPTEDDLTREAVAAALGRPLRSDPAVLEAIRRRAAAHNYPFPENNRKQADVIEGATVLRNDNGSAPGLFLDTTHQGQRRIMLLLPGPPKELMPMFEQQARPLLAAALPKRFLARRMLRMALQPESSVDARTAPIYRRYADVETTILAGKAEIQLHFSCAKASLAEAQARVDEVCCCVEAEMHEDVFSDHGESLAEVVVHRLDELNLTLAVAESCTGGLLAARITDVPGCSRSFLGGAVVYTNALKTAFADVPPSLLADHGAVSEQVAAALAEGIRKRTGAAIGIGITGIAGPTGATAEKPVGLVYIALAQEGKTRAKKLNLMGDRENIRWRASQHALELLRRSLA
ncbi:MAG: competence/damage-inducible protein A [Acidobacteriaceae bacterium]|nr:competence/damage-inducible protein A [Acidobacteriaceae bacterium]